MAAKKKNEIFKIGDLVQFPVYSDIGHKTYEIGVITDVTDFQKVNGKSFYKIYTHKAIGTNNFRIYHESALIRL
jgi:hypothetical protein